MIYSLYEHEGIEPKYLWAILFAMPTLLAAGALDLPGKDATLPSLESYRSNFSDTIMNSSTWRKPAAPEISWREATPPSIGWRTPSSTKSPKTSTRRSITLFPKYQPGRTSDFDYITREEKPLIKVFEFGR